MESRRTFLKKFSLAGATAIVTSQTAWARTRGSIARQNVTLEEAWAVHKKCLIFDGHNDAAVERLEHEMPLNWMGKSDVYNTDMQRARENGQKYVAFMIMAPGRGTTAQAFRNMAEVARQVEQHPKDLAQVISSADAVAAAAAGKVGIINAIEGCFGPLAGDLENLKKFYAKGLRLAGISHGEGGADSKYLQGARSGTNHIAPAARAQNLRTMVGLTPFGVEVLKLSNLLGIVTDLAHINDRAFFDVVERSTLPPIVSHTDVYSICQGGRCYR